MSLMIGIVLVAAILIFLFRSRTKESHHLDDLHIRT